MDEFAMNDDHTIEPMNKNIPNTTKENIKIGKLVFHVISQKTLWNHFQHD